ncbi:hypothetical protein O181_056090 [Austropuccinia psidii MF-1]|uniref:Uncharacterized protein n=1 Tax=Austropuccinia psidii MF-1 TaxID=1389203 RepID=A0A9Q3E5J7_9BASI|nr:hypothetical protein [Austropuccinia psidii MF-1]
MTSNESTEEFSGLADFRICSVVFFILRFFKKLTFTQKDTFPQQLQTFWPTRPVSWASCRFSSVHPHHLTRNDELRINVLPYKQASNQKTREFRRNQQHSCANANLKRLYVFDDDNSHPAPSALSGHPENRETLIHAECSLASLRGFESSSLILWLFFSTSQNITEFLE